MRSFRIVIAGHGAFPAALLASTEMICGPLADIVAAGIEPTDTPDRYAEALRAAIGRDGAPDHVPAQSDAAGSGASLPAEAGRTARSSTRKGRVLVLCDLLGGTPFNVASAISRRSPRIVCISGVNLAMAVEAALADGDLDDALVERLLATGRDAIVETERHRAQRAS